MERFTHSPLRAWRRFYTFFGLLISCVAICVFVDWPYTQAPKDNIMLIFPGLLLIAGLMFTYVGALADDQRLMKFHQLFQRLGG